MLRFFFSLLLIAGVADASTNVTISTHYDDRTCAVIFDIDDYYTASAAAFHNAIDIAASNRVVVSVGIMTSLNNPSSWASMQTRIDAGEAVPISHSYTAINYQAWTNMAHAEAVIPDEISRSITNMTANLTLPDWQIYNGKEYLNTWIQPWGTAKLADGTDIQWYVRDVLSTNLFLSDSATTGGSRYAWPAWDSGVGNNGLFLKVGRVGIHYTSEYSDLAYHTNAFNSAYASNFVYHIYSHPQTDPLDGVNENGIIAKAILEHVGNRQDVWYAGLDQATHYNYLKTVATPSIAVDEQSAHTDISVSVDETERTKYGLGFPLTYEYELSTELAGADDLYVYVRHGDLLNFSAVTEKTTNDWYQAENVWRQEGDTLYLSQGFSTTDTTFTLRVTSAPIGSTQGYIPSQIGRGMIQ